MMTSAVALILAITVASAPAIDFDTQIVPVLTRSGCNVGSCHGAAAGRGGFHLSLLGGDAAADYEAIARQYEGRRINLADPKKSLLIRKPTVQLDHEGGDALDSDGAELVEQWIQSGARRLRSRKLTRLDVEPTSRLVESIGGDVQLRITAHFDDGRSEDATRWTVFTSSDPSSISIDATSYRAKLLRRGQHTVIARYLDRVVPIRLTVPLSDRAVDHTHEPQNNLIDGQILRTLTELRLPTSPLADDATYLRRVHLDLIGRLPTRQEVESFIADESPTKRVELVDRLLESEAFLDYWTYRFANLLRILPQPNDKEGARTYHRWVRERIRDRTPFDKIAHELLTAIGDSHQVGAANFARTSSDARAQAELVSQVFMGTRLQCANCHNHPLDRWTQDDYHGLAAVFARLERGQIVKLASRGGVTNVRTGEPAVPRIPGVRFLDSDQDGRHPFADWLTSPDNPYLARAFVNRLWRGMFGRGLVEPADDVRETNPATHPELLDALAQDFVDHRYDLRHTLRRIALSSTYARSSQTNQDNQADDRFYSHAFRRPLEPEVLADALFDVTGVPDRYGEEPTGTRAVQLFDPLTPAESLDVLGRCSRKESCEGVTVAGALPTKLHQLNGQLINSKVTSKDGRLHQLIEAGAKNAEIVNEFYLRALGRWPTTVEQRHWNQQLDSLPDAKRVTLLEDILWGLLNCSEFALNH